jgi:hypothetical protein
VANVPRNETDDLAWENCRAENGDRYFHGGGETAPPISSGTQKTKAILKFIAQHLDKDIHVASEEHFDEITDESWIEVGDETGIGLDKYTEGFRG